jgi:hypothetical protein
MLIFLITLPRGSIQPGANQMRQRLEIQEQFRRGNATSHPDRRATLEPKALCGEGLGMISMAVV